MNQKKAYKFNLFESKKTFEISALISAYYYTNKPSFVPRYEQYDFAQIFLILEGDGIYTDPSGKNYRLMPGMMLYRPANQSSYYEWKSEQVRFGLVSFSCPAEEMKSFEGAPISLQGEELSALWDVIQTGTRVCEELKEDDPQLGMRFKPDIPPVVLGFIASSMERFLSMLYCRLQNITILVDETQKVNRYLDRSKLVDEVKQYLSDHISEQLQIVDIATYFSIGQTSLTYKFQHETGCSIIDYFNRLKIERAKHLIRHTSLNFTQISEELGFTSSYYFSRLFKIKTGVTPTEYSRHASKRLANFPEEIENAIENS